VDEWDDRSSSAGPLISCTLIVTAANKFASRVHDRMRCFFGRRILGRGWTDPLGQSFSNLQADDLLQVWPVSKRVNRPGNDGDLSLVEPIEVTNS
jgi:putative SOS response-associated peptidase YedK